MLNFHYMSRRVPVFTVGSEKLRVPQAARLTRSSDGASLEMDIESLDKDELRRSVRTAAYFSA